VTNAPLDELYFRWLYKQVGSITERDKSKTHFELMRVLFQKEFLWWVPNDDNRVEDGRDLRLRFVHYSGVSPDDEWMGLGCSFLEMLIALSHRLSFETGMKPKGWFWRLIENLGLEELTDKNWGEMTAEAVDETLERVIWRNYEPDGLGGLFPLEHPEHDQREVEIWYQLCAYLNEHD
jgi:hypothetical protein